MPSGRPEPASPRGAGDQGLRIRWGHERGAPSAPPAVVRRRAASDRRRGRTSGTDRRGALPRKTRDYGGLACGLRDDRTRLIPRRGSGGPDEREECPPGPNPVHPGTSHRLGSEDEHPRLRVSKGRRARRSAQTLLAARGAEGGSDCLGYGHLEYRGGHNRTLGPERSGVGPPCRGGDDALACDRSRDGGWTADVGAPGPEVGATRDGIRSGCDWTITRSDERSRGTHEAGNHPLRVEVRRTSEGTGGATLPRGGPLPSMARAEIGGS